MADEKGTKKKAAGGGAAKLEERTDAGSSVGTVRALRERYPALDADEVAYFEARQSVEQAHKAGARTVAADVLPDMVRLAVKYEQARAASKTVATFITPAQMRWLCDHIVRLGEAVERRDRKGVTTAVVSTAVQTAWDGGRAVRNELLGAAEEYVKGSEADTAALAAARGAADKPDVTRRSLGSLADLGATWLKRTDKRSSIAAREATLTPDLVERAKAAAEALRKAIDADAQHGARGRAAQDTPEINALEGRVELTFRMVRHNHNRAREKDPTVEAVAVPDSLKAALHVGTRAKVAAVEGTPEGPPGAPDATPATPRATKAKSKRRKVR